MNARSLADLNAPAALDDGLEALGVTVEVGGKTLLQTASVRFTAGEVTAILGPNGAGKSTLMSVLTGQRQPSAGQVRLAGQALADCPNAALARLRACVAQETQVAFDFTVREVVELGRYPHRRQPSAQEASIVLQAMQQAAVAHLRHRALNTLSGGEKARVHLARALAQVWEPVAGADGSYPPRWLLLDEPTAALDLRHQHRMLQLARSRAHGQGLGVVAVLHDLNLALRYSDRCVVLQSGQVVASGPTAGVLTAGCIRQVWGVAARAVPAAPGVADGGALQYVFEPVPVAPGL
ncbi:MAG: heme transporter ATP-binding protein [Polaromonas sp.]|nr:heme transporter ATP-binding protein [Polaromonas sp.]